MQTSPDFFFQFNPALYVNNGPKHDLSVLVFNITLYHLWVGAGTRRIGR